MTESEEIIANTVLNLNKDILKSVLNNLEKFIKESNTDTLDKDNFSDYAIVTAGFVMAINELDKNFHPSMSKTIIEMLQNNQKKSMN